MKKYAAIFLVLLPMTFCFVGCNSKSNEIYTSLIADSAADEYHVRAEINYWTGTYFEKKGMGNQSCLVSGNRYSGAYSKSITDKMNSYTTDIYVDDDHLPPMVIYVCTLI